MKKTSKKLLFKAETIRTLNAPELEGVAGGTTTAINCTVNRGFKIMHVQWQSIFCPQTTAPNCGSVSSATTALTCTNH